MVQQQPAPPLVVFSLHKRLVAMNAHTGQRVWECETELPHDGRLFVDQGLVIYAFSSLVLCLDYLTGALRWKAGVPLKLEMVGLVYAGCVIIAGMGEMVCLNAQNGAQLWHEKFKGYGVLSGALAAPGVAAQIDKRS